MIENGATEEQIADHDFELWVRSYRAFREYRLLIQPPRSHEVEVFVLQGPTGTGKSKWAMDNYPDAYWKQRSIWWDGYAKQETVIIDEFYGWMPFDTLLRVCDRYPLLVETKGGQVNFVAKTIIITTTLFQAHGTKMFILTLLFVGFLSGMFYVRGATCRHSPITVKLFLPSY